jgi:hypothetical protein
VVDATGSYAMFWPLMLVVGVIAAVANWVTRPMKVATA